MKASVRQMQGVSSYIETHYEVMSYWKQEMKVCHFARSGKCENKESIQCNKSCIGYTKCADFISDSIYSEKLTKATKKDMK